MQLIGLQSQFSISQAWQNHSHQNSSKVSFRICHFPFRIETGKPISTLWKNENFSLSACQVSCNLHSKWTVKTYPTTTKKRSPMRWPPLIFLVFSSLVSFSVHRVYRKIGNCHLAASPVKRNGKTPLESSTNHRFCWHEDIDKLLNSFTDWYINELIMALHIIGWSPH